MVVTAEPFDSLLEWLDRDRDVAGQKYEVIRSGLIRIFVSKGFSDAEDLADEAINRVMTRLPEIRGHYEGEPARYFHGVARNIFFEARRRKETLTEVTAIAAPPLEHTPEYDCLLECLGLLSPDKRDLIVDYYLYKGPEKIQQHRRMAEELHITEGALRNRTFQVRITLEKCVSKCIGNQSFKQKPHPPS